VAEAASATTATGAAARRQLGWRYTFGCPTGPSCRAPSPPPSPVEMRPRLLANGLQHPRHL